ncbi:hypothetical protein GM418_06385 [Maribellus comscasis]|uniref:Uncharacterized protein n=1 Tax=Maribellus comscasis TaxID=2681766 RepID=A0A6I6JQ77_9BACT|nr:hypothetical protein [Maribellus comscasis]QGY43299.1 hypothetical protein GM418_06385 [Maribellus comscasis]
MGYNGLGMQRWISTMKPRKFLSKRSKPDGGGMEHLSNQEIEAYFHLKKNKLDKLLKKKYSLQYKEKLKRQISDEHRRNTIFTLLSIIISFGILLLLFFYFGAKMQVF